MKPAMVIFVLLLSLLLSASIGAAHPGTYVAAHLKVNRDGSFRVHARFDLLAFALNDTPTNVDDASMNALLEGPRADLDAALANARERFLRAVTIRCDDAVIRAAAIQFPGSVDVYRWRDANVLPRLPVTLGATLDGAIPPGARSIAIKFPEVLGTLVLTVERPGEEAYSEPIDGGRYSSTLPIQFKPTQQAAKRAGLRYVALGFIHIVPHGLDHMLFVVGLFLLSPKLKPLLWQVTAFTVAHSITLALSLHGVLHLRASVVEPLIALSIAFIAIENLFTTKLKPWRPIIVFGFGLVHGLGFAGVLSELGLPRSQIVAALLGFNVGVEAGQLAVLALAFAAVGLFRQRTWYRHIIAMPASCAIAAVAVVWTIQRIHH